MEATAFVSPKWIPQMKDHTSVLEGIKARDVVLPSSSISFPVLVPNLKGLHDAISAGAKEVAVFTTVSESFCKKNVNCSIAESVQRIEEIMRIAIKNDIKVRGLVDGRCIRAP